MKQSDTSGCGSLNEMFREIPIVPHLVPALSAQKAFFSVTVVYVALSFGGRS